MIVRVWQRLDVPGHEVCRISRGLIKGDVIVIEEGRPCALRYRIECDDSWRTRSARIEGFANGQNVEIALAPDGRWIDDCVDVDLGLTPSTNTLPIRRLGLQVGESASVSAAWLRFPELTLERLDQTYTRLAESLYRFETRTGFSADLEVDEEGLVTRYGDLWASIGVR
jgi:hypothetical protein